MKKFRLDKRGQLRLLSEEEMHESFSQDDRWTLRPIFVVIAALACAAVVIYHLLHKS